MRGVLRLPLPAGAAAAAPVTGVQVGVGARGPLTLRVFRRPGTRAVAVRGAAPLGGEVSAAEWAAQLLALRAAAAGAGVRVMTARNAVWAPVIAHGLDAAIMPPGTAWTRASGPMVVVDDRPEETRMLGETGPWQCRLDVRTPASAADLTAIAHADVALVGALPASLALAATSAFGVPASAAVQLSTLPDGSLAVLRRGHVDVVSLDPTPAELALLRAAR